MSNPKVTLADVAERAGMSAATASRALRGMKVHRKYQGKAEAAAAELGYVLNEAARSLRSVRTMTVGMVFHDLTSMLGMELLRAVTAGLDEVGYSLFVSTAQGRSDHFDKLAHRFLQRRVDALVCVHGDGEGAVLEGYAAAGVPVMALITKNGGYSRLPMISPTTAGASRECLARLHELGHRRGVLLAPDRAAPPIAAVADAAKDRRFPLERIEYGADGVDAKTLLREIMDKRQKPTVVFALFAQAVRILEAARAQRIGVPDDLSIVALRDRSTLVAATPLALSTIHIDPAPMGQLASDVLKAWLVDGSPLKRDRKVEVGTWIERETTGPVRR